MVDQLTPTLEGLKMAAEGESVIITDDEIFKAVSKIIHPATNFTIISSEVKPASEEPLGFLGEHVRIKVTVKQDDEEIKTFQFFGKKIPTKCKSHLEYAKGTKAFYKEIEMYKTLFDEMSKAVVKDSKKWRPDFYFSRGIEFFLVEDLSVQGYRMVSECNSLDLDHILATCRAMARMHSASFVFEKKFRSGDILKSKFLDIDRKNATIWDLYPNLVFESECTNEPGHPGFLFWETGIRSQLPVIDLMPNYTKEQKEVIKAKFPDLMRKVYDFARPSKIFKNVMIHGDLWTNNILFRETPSGLDAVFVDFQMTRYGPPAHDLMMFLYIVQRDAFRAAHESDIIQHYYESLTQELKQNGVSVNEVLPREVFNSSVEYYREYALLNSIIYCQLNLTPPHVAAEFLSSPELFEKIMRVDRSEMLVKTFLEDQTAREITIEVTTDIVKYYNLV